MALAIEVGRSNVYIVQAKVRKGKIVIKKMESFDFPEEWISDKGITNVEAFQESLDTTLKEGRFSDKDVYLCINNSSIIYRELVVPRIEEKRLPLLVRSEMMSVLNLTPDYVMDYRILEEVSENERSLYRILAVAIQDKALDTYVGILKNCKLKIRSIDSATNAIIKLSKDLDIFADNQQLILADIANNHLRLYLFENGEYSLSRNNRLIVFNEESEESFINTIVDNINKMVQFSYTRYEGQNAKKIVLTGLDNILPTIKNRINEELMIPCEILDKPRYIESEVEYQQRYINAVGTLIRK